MSKGGPLRHSAGEADTVIEAGATFSMTPPAHVHPQQSAGSPSGSRTRYAYSLIGVAGSRCLALGRTGATTSPSRGPRAFSRIAASIRPDRPRPRRPGLIVISMALTVSGSTPGRGR